MSAKCEQERSTVPCLLGRQVPKFSMLGWGLKGLGSAGHAARGIRGPGRELPQHAKRGGVVTGRGEVGAGAYSVPLACGGTGPTRYDEDDSFCGGGSDAAATHS